MEIQTVSGTIIKTDRQETPEWKKFTFGIRNDDDGKTHYISFFQNEKDIEAMKLKKESWISDFKEGDKVTAEYTEKNGYKTLLSITEPIEKIDEKLNAVPIAKEEKKYPKIEMNILRGSCFNAAALVIANAELNPDHSIVEEKILKLAKRIYSKAMQEKFLEW